MLNENAKKWVEALRSGKYKQGKSRLNEGDKFCCLGVACDIYEKETGDKRLSRSSDGNFHGGYLTNDKFIVKNWLGLNTAKGEFFENSEDIFPTSLPELNDDKNYTFEQIADVIESEPKDLFKD